MATTPDSIALVIAAVGAIGAVGAAIGALLSARATQRAAEGQLAVAFLGDYTSPDMLRALRVLRNYRAAEGDGFEETWRRRLEAADAHALEVDQARRKVKGYFLNALRLHEFGYVNERFVGTVASVDGINILYDIVEPLEYALNPAYDRARFERIRTMCGRSRTERLIRPIPYEAASPPET